MISQATPVCKCQRCGRTLKNPKSIALGLGITCARKAAVQAATVIPAAAPGVRESAEYPGLTVEVTETDAVSRVVRFCHNDGELAYVVSPTDDRLYYASPSFPADVRGHCGDFVRKLSARLAAKAVA